MRTLVTFRSSAFNTSEPQPYFINENSFGDDLARWLIAHLRAGGVSVNDTPGQEDFGWFFEFDVPEGKHCCVLGLRPVDDPNESNWVAWIERSRGFLGSIFGLRKQGIAPSALSALHAVEPFRDLECSLARSARLRRRARRTWNGDTVSAKRRACRQATRDLDSLPRQTQTTESERGTRKPVQGRCGPATVTGTTPAHTSPLTE